MRSADNETACGVDEELCLIIDEFLRKDRIKDIFLNVFMDLFLSNIIVMLC